MGQGLLVHKMTILHWSICTLSHKTLFAFPLTQFLQYNDLPSISYENAHWVLFKQETIFPFIFVLFSHSLFSTHYLLPAAHSYIHRFTLDCLYVIGLINDFGLALFFFLFYIITSPLHSLNYSYLGIIGTCI